jgi:hypothetical protein
MGEMIATLEINQLPSHTPFGSIELRQSHHPTMPHTWKWTFPSNQILRGTWRWDFASGAALHPGFRIILVTSQLPGGKAKLFGNTGIWKKRNTGAREPARPWFMMGFLWVGECFDFLDIEWNAVQVIP